MHRCRAFGVVALLVAGTASAPLAFAHGDETDAESVDYSNVEEHPFGKASNPASASQIIEMEMSDKMRFSPAEVTVLAGQTVKFVVTNRGTLVHEMVLGTQETLEEHAALMKKFPGMEHDEPYMAHVSPGDTQVMGWQFTEPGVYHFGCLVPGHFDAGMHGTITVN